jgi:hypothetical protein
MRAETQPWNAITARLEVLLSGAGVTGLSPVATIQRVVDSQYWNGTNWQVGATTVAMTAVDATNFPGVYEAAVLAGQLNHTLGLRGYRFRVYESTSLTLENGFILQQRRSPWEDLVTEYVGAGTFGQRAAMALGIGGQFWSRIMGQAGPNPVYDAEGRLLTARHVAYPSSADVSADTNRIGQIDVTMTYDVDGNLATFKAE